VPLHRDLAAQLRTWPQTAMTILTNSLGTPWVLAGFHSAWRRERPTCCKGLVWHGLRKSAVVTLIEAGCTPHQVSAVTGQSLEMVEHYGRRYNRRQLASEAVKLWEGRGQIANTAANTRLLEEQKLG
jgi:integrase